MDVRTDSVFSFSIRLSKPTLQSRKPRYSGEVNPDAECVTLLTKYRQDSDADAFVAHNRFMLSARCSTLCRSIVIEPAEELIFQRPTRPDTMWQKGESEKRRIFEVKMRSGKVSSGIRSGSCSTSCRWTRSISCPLAAHSACRGCAGRQLVAGSS